MEYKFNINNSVRVKINDDGYQHIIDHYAAFNIEKTKDKLLHKADENGYTQMQLHEFMRLFGDMGMGFDPLFDLDIIFSSNDLREIGE